MGVRCCAISAKTAQDTRGSEAWGNSSCWNQRRSEGVGPAASRCGAPLSASGARRRSRDGRKACSEASTQAEGAAVQRRLAASSSAHGLVREGIHGLGLLEAHGDLDRRIRLTQEGLPPCAEWSGPSGSQRQQGSLISRTVPPFQALQVFGN